jgi:hypothetical protein
MWGGAGLASRPGFPISSPGTRVSRLFERVKKDPVMMLVVVRDEVG